MTTVVFDDKAKEPQDKNLAKALGKAKKLWDDLCNHLEQEYPPVTVEWKFYSKKSGWTCKIVHKKRTIVHLRPVEGAFLVATAFGEKAVEAARKSKLPKKVINQINEARQYAEGRQARLEVKTSKDLDSAKQIAAIKMAN